MGPLPLHKYMKVALGLLSNETKIEKQGIATKTTLKIKETMGIP